MNYKQGTLTFCTTNPPVGNNLNVNGISNKKIRLMNNKNKALKIRT